MNNRCPHCDARLPDARDAFCLECRQPLDEPPFDPSGVPPQTVPPSLAPLDIAGAEGMSWNDLAPEVRQGGRLVVYQYCVSLGILTLLQPSKIHLVRFGESAVVKGLPYTLLSLVAGWWGVPWGFVYTPMAVCKNLGGGSDVTEILASQTHQEDKAK
jgi:hypothetical protein